MKQLFNFQKQALHKLDNRSKALLALDMGLGKTFTGLNWWKNKHDHNDTILFIMCQKNKINDWEKEVTSLFPNKKVVIIKSLKQFDKELDSMKHANPPNIYIFNYSVFTLYTTNKNPFWYKELPKHGLIFDESQGLRNRTSNISQRLLKWTPSIKYLLMLSGDPTPNGYKDLFSQMRILEITPKGFSWNYFLENYCKTWEVQQYVHTIIGYTNIEHLMSLLEPHSYFLSTTQAVDLPSQWWLTHDINYNKYYKQFHNNKLIDLPEYEYTHVSNGTLSEMTSLRQIASGFIKRQDNNDIIDINSDRIELLQSILSEMKVEPIVIFYNFTHEKDIIKSNITDRNFVEINGQQNDYDINHEYSSNTIFLCQYQAAAKGIDGLQKWSNRMIYYSPTLSGELYKQSIKRIHRIGQEQKCFYHKLICSPLELKIYETLSKYQDFTTDIFESLNNQLL